jgi:hypothetical protein
MSIRTHTFYLLHLIGAIKLYKKKRDELVSQFIIGLKDYLTHSL